MKFLNEKTRVESRKVYVVVDFIYAAVPNSVITRYVIVCIICSYLKYAKIHKEGDGKISFNVHALKFESIVL